MAGTLSMAADPSGQRQIRQQTEQQTENFILDILPSFEILEVFMPANV